MKGLFYMIPRSQEAKISFKKSLMPVWEVIKNGKLSVENSGTHLATSVRL